LLECFLFETGFARDMANLHIGAPNAQQVSTFRTTLPYRRLVRGRGSIGGTTRCNERPDATTCGLRGALEGNFLRRTDQRRFFGAILGRLLKARKPGQTG
jgi:hypothetical protein